MLKIASALALCAVPSLALADARVPVEVLPASTGGTPQLATTADISVVTVDTGGSSNLFLRIADGRGIQWGPLLAVDPPLTSDLIGYRQAAIASGQVFVAWADDRNYQVPLWPMVARTLYVRVFDAATGVGGSEIEVPTGTIPAHTSSGGYDFVALEVGGAVHLHIASLQSELDPVTGVIQRQVVLYSSHDGGATWLAPLAITPPGPEYYNDVRVLADGNHVHVLYTDGTLFTKPQLYDQRSIDGGATADFAVPTPVPGAYQAWEFDADLDGQLLAIAYENFEADFAFSSAAVVTSRDGGLTYEQATGFSAPSVFVDQSFDPRVAITDDTQDVVAVASGFDLSGNSFILRSYSDQGGQTWTPGSLVVQGNVKQPEVETGGSGRERAVATWLELNGSGYTIRAATSFDRGSNFAAPLEVAPTGTSYYRLAYNGLHQNALISFGQATGIKPQFVGGYRPQTMIPSGITTGSTSISATFEHFDGGADLAWLLLSTDTASQELPLGDGRELGVGITPLYSSLLPLALGGLTAAPLDASGRGAMAPLPIAAPGVPPGLHLYAVGLSFDFATASFVDISDVAVLDT